VTIPTVLSDVATLFEFQIVSTSYSSPNHSSQFGKYMNYERQTYRDGKSFNGPCVVSLPLQYWVCYSRESKLCCLSICIVTKAVILRQFLQARTKIPIKTKLVLLAM
jgi:hypothetical protein